MTQQCTNCGAVNLAAARFCFQCGQSLTGSLAPAQPAPAQPPSGAPVQPAPAQPAQQPAGMPGTGMLAPQSLLAGRYIILRRVGQGGMGAVYEAADSRIPGKTWAVKEMSDAALSNPLDRQQAADGFRREAQVLSLLDHPNIPKVTDYFSEGNKLYLVMEFVTGDTLQKKLERQGGPLPETEVRRWAEQLLDVLDYLHRQNPPIVFRDLKPGNIMIDGTGKIKLIDFGIVRFFQPGKTADTASIGTAGYAPPEQYGKGQTDARSDLYALGATLHHLLTDRDPVLTPFQFPRPRTLNPNVSQTMDQVIMRALEQDRDKRWQNAHEMMQALQGTAPAAPQAAVPAWGAVAVSAVPAQAPYSAQPSYGGTTPASRAPAFGQGVVGPRPRVSSPFLTDELAGFGRRAAAYIIDSVLMYGVFLVLYLPGLVTTDSYGNPNATLSCVGSILGLGVQIWYYIFFQSRSGQTLGKKWLGIKVVSADGTPLTRGRFVVRYLGYMVSSLMLYIGWLMPLWDPDQQAMQDKLARTFVVRA